MKKQVSSFGLPDDVKRAMADHRATKVAKKEPEAKPDEELKQEPEVQPEVKVSEKKERPARNPEKEGRALLEEIGVEFSEDDFHNYLFRGCISKRITVSKTKDFEFTAEVKTLSGHELDLADELLAADIDKLKMTRDGMLARRSVWYLSFGIQKLVDRELVKPIYKPGNEENKQLDLVAMAKEKRKIILDLAPSVTDKLIRGQAVITSALNLFVENKNTLFLGNAPAQNSSELEQK